MEGWIRDARYGVRRLRTRPTYTLLAVLTLALGVGGTAAIYSIAKRLLLELLPVRAEEEVATSWMEGSWSEAEFLALRPEIQGLGSLAAYRSRDVTMQPGDAPARLVKGVAATAELFQVLGARPAVGSGFRAGDDRAGTEPVAVLSHSLWRELGGDPGIVGQQIELGGVARTVVGVMPPGFWFPDPTVRVWLAEELNPEDRSGNWGLIGRMHPGTGVEGMGGELDRIMKVMHEHFNATEADLSPEPVPARYMTHEQVPWLLPMETFVIRMQDGRNPAVVLNAARRAIQQTAPQVAIQDMTTMENVFDRAIGPARQVMSLLTLLGGLALVLGTIGVYGVVAHFVTRRKRDWGIRIALGMLPRRVIRQIVGQGAALVGLGIAVGLVGFFLLAQLLASFLYGVGTADALALAGATAILLVAGLLAALVPAWRASRIDPAVVLREQ